MPKHNTLTFRRREFKGSRLRCLLATHQSADQVVAFLHSISGGRAVVQPNRKWAPRGFLEPAEIKLDEPNFFLNETQREQLAEWWLAKRGRANTPNWDLVSKASIEGVSGLLLVEAKSHAGEFSDDRCGASNKDNYARICGVLAEVSAEWNALEPGFVLSADRYYQLSNRFAFAWKLASMGIPTVLVYLGFVNAQEMKSRKLLQSHADWHDVVLNRSQGIVPAKVWNRRFEVGHNRTPVHVLISSAEVSVGVSSVSAGATHAH